jgi:polyphenol oxidase
MTSLPHAFSLRVLPNGWNVGELPALAALAGLAHAVTTRGGPIFGPHAESPSTAAACATLTATVGLRDAAWCRQVHGATVLVAARGGLVGEADALVTRADGLGVIGRSADCPIVLAADPAARVAGMAHASWRSTVQGITGRLVATMVTRGGADPARLVCAIAPSAGPCCYEVGAEVRAAALAGIGPHAGEFFAARGDGRCVFDLWAANVNQLRRAGVSATNITVAGICTLCRNDLFPSWRREGEKAGRFASIVGWRETT